MVLQEAKKNFLGLNWPIVIFFFGGPLDGIFFFGDPPNEFFFSVLHHAPPQMINGRPLNPWQTNLCFDFNLK